MNETKVFNKPIGKYEYVKKLRSWINQTSVDISRSKNKNDYKRVEMYKKEQQKYRTYLAKATKNGGGLKYDMVGKNSVHQEPQISLFI